jgi:predicted metal-dependent peptidase
LLFLYDPEVIEKWKLDDVKTAWFHEGLHIMLRHFARVGDRDKWLWNLAGDLFITQQQEEAGLKLLESDFHPTRGVFEKDPLPLNLTTEEYYSELVKRQDEAKKQIAEALEGMKGCGSCSGNPLEGEPEGSEAESEGGRSAEDVRHTIKAVALAIQDQAQKGRGNIPGGLKILVDDLLKPPKVPWQTKLARVAKYAIGYRPGAVDFRYSRVSRRQAAIGWGIGKPILAGLVAPVPEVVVCLDSSASMGKDEIQDSLTEVAGILRTVGARIRFVVIDTKVNSSKVVTNPSELADCLIGGGGTDFRPAFDHIQTLNPKPEVLIFATDGCGPAPSVAPVGMSVIWLLVGSHKQKPFTDNGDVSYGDVIEID